MKRIVKGSSNVQAMLLLGLLGGGGATYMSNMPSSHELSQQSMDAAVKMFKQAESAALNDYVKNGAWASDLTVLKTNGSYHGYDTSPYGTNFEFVPNGSGGLIKMTVKSANEAKQLANRVGNGQINGLVVTKQIGTPAEGALRNSLLSDYVDITSTNTLSYQTDIQMNGKSINDVAQLGTEQLTVNKELQFPNATISNSATGLNVDAAIVQLTGGIQVTEGVTSKTLTVTDTVNAKKIETPTLDAVIADIDSLTATKSTINSADIDLLKANTATLTNTVTQTLKVSGLAELADVIGNNATFNTKINAGALQLSGTAIVNLLDAEGIDVQSAAITKAEVANLVGVVARLQTLNTDLATATRFNASYADVDRLTSGSATIDQLISQTVKATSFDADNLKALNATLDTVNAQTVNVLGTANFKTLVSQTGTITTLNADTATIKQANAQNVVVSGKTTTNTLDVKQSASIAKNLNVGGTVTAAAATLNNATINGTATAVRVNVTDSATVAGLTKTSSLNVTNSATVGGNVTASTVNATNAHYTNKLTAKTLQTTTANVSGNIQSNTVNTGTANVSGTLTSGVLKATTANLTNAAVSNGLTVGVKLTTRDLVVNVLATIKTASIDNLVANVSNIGTASGSSLTVSNGVTAGSGSFTTMNVTGKGTFGSLESKGNATVGGALTVYGDISGRNLTVSGKVTSASASLGAVTASTVNASGVVQGQDVKTASGVSLNGLSAGFKSHDGRIYTMEQWIAMCQSKAVPECNR